MNQHIKELLLEHDCVILPGLGGFVGNYQPARFNESQQTVRPPSKQILFNPNLVHNDGLLYGHLSKQIGMGYKEVQEKVGDLIVQIRKTVEAGQKFDMEGIGYFFRGKDRNLQFEADESANFLSDSYGLPFLNYRVFDAPAVRRTRPAMEETSQPAQQRIRRWIYAATAACIVGAMVMIPIRNGQWNMAGLDFIRPDSQTAMHQSLSVTETQNTQLPAGQEPGPSDTPAEFSALNTPEDPGSRAAGTGSSSLPDPEIRPVPAPLPDQYHIVVGSFRNFGNARALRSQLLQQGYDARILSAPNQYFRVSARTFSTMEQAQTAMPTVRKDFGSAWLLHN